MSKYTVQYSSRAIKDLKKLDNFTKQMIFSWIGNHLEGCENPRQTGKALKGNKEGFWRYRIGDYRLICDISDDSLIILTLAVGHRKEIYKK